MMLNIKHQDDLSKITLEDIVIIIGQQIRVIAKNYKWQEILGKI